MEFINAYEDTRRAEAYAKLEFPGTYYLAYRDLPDIILRHVKGRKAIDFGCGTGRSSRFLQGLGFNVTGVDVAADMIKLAQTRDPNGAYCLVEDGNLGQFQADAFDLVLSVFTFDNIPTVAKKVAIFREFGRLLKSEGIIVNLVSSPQIYVNEWASFTTKNFPENKYARSGEKVKIIITDIEDQRPVEDIVWTDKAYQEVFKRAGLQIVDTYRPLAKESEPYQWVSETRIAPWVIYVLKRD
ncbi:MAG: class I SAM-dependent methyltransferase [Anaerolineae bacterium]|nr:class I SAM-dependent methyltransferase [Anaerolineae bacterium]